MDRGPFGDVTANATNANDTGAPEIDGDALDRELIDLHNDVAHARRLSELHEAAAALHANDPKARRFQLTHAWVFALVDGDDVRAERLAADLRALGGF